MQDMNIHMLVTKDEEESHSYSSAFSLSSEQNPFSSWHGFFAMNTSAQPPTLAITQYITVPMLQPCFSWFWKMQTESK
jgi:hypothetical protein